AKNAHGGVADIERAHQVHLDDGLQSFHANLVEDHVAQDAGIVDDAVEAAEVIGRRLDDPARRDRFRHRVEVWHRSAAALLDFLNHFLGRRGRGTRAIRRAAGIVDHDLGAFGGAEQRDLAPDAAARAGDDDDLVLQRFCHWVLLLAPSFRDGAKHQTRNLEILRCVIAHHSSRFARPGMTKGYFSFVKMIVPDAANMPPTPWHTDIFASLTCAAAMPRIWRTLSCSAYMPYMPECM